MTEKEQFSKHGIVYSRSKAGKSRLMAELAVLGANDLVEYPNEWRSDTEGFISREAVDEVCT